MKRGLKQRDIDRDRLECVAAESTPMKRGLKLRNVRGEHDGSAGSRREHPDEEGTETP